MFKTRKILFLAVSVLMLSSCTYNLTLDPSSSVSQEPASSAAQSYPIEQPPFDDNPLQPSSSEQQDQGASSMRENPSAEPSSSQQTSSKAASSKQSSSKETAAFKETSSKEVASKEAVSKEQSSSKDAVSQRTAAPTGELRAVWISYLDLETMLKNKSASAAKAAINKAFDNATDLSLNAVIVQVRPFADALYDSDYFPWSRVLTGTQGKAPGYDPLELMVNSAKARELELHVWINPYRVLTSTDYSKLSKGHIASEWKDEGNDYTVAVDGKGIFFNPARKEVRNLVVDGVTELVERYDIDGVHFDDYFYPTTAASFDKNAYREYTAGGGAKSLTSWRMENVNRLISQTYAAIKEINPSVRFGVSPNGNIDQNYSTLYADVKTWCKTPGYIDYIMPQLYYGFDNATCPYDDTTAAWNSLITAKGVKLYAGLAVYKIGTEDQWAGAGKTEWQDTNTMLNRQVAAARAYSRYGGFALYRYDSAINPASSVTSRVKKELDNLMELL